MIPGWCSSLARAARGLRARGRPARALGADLDPGPGCSRRACPAGCGWSPDCQGAGCGALGSDRDVDRGPRRRPDRPGRGSCRSSSPPRPAAGVTAVTATRRPHNSAFDGKCSGPAPALSAACAGGCFRGAAMHKYTADPWQLDYRLGNARRTRRRGARLITRADPPICSAFGCGPAAAAAVHNWAFCQPWVLRRSLVSLLVRAGCHRPVATKGEQHPLGRGVAAGRLEPGGQDRADAHAEHTRTCH